MGVCALGRIVHTGRVVEALVADSTWWDRKLQCAADRLVKFVPVLVGRPAGVVGVALALVVHTVHLLDLTNPFGAQDTIGCQQQRSEQ